MGRRRKPMIERYPIRRRRLLLERQFQSIIFTATCEIKKIEAKIHRIVITSNKYEIDKIEKILGELSPNYDYYHSDEKPYNKMSDTTWNGLKIQVHTEPNPYKQKVRVDIIPPENISAEKYKSLLVDLIDIFGKFNISCVEYTIDIFQRDRIYVDLLFWVIKKYLYLRLKRSLPFIYDEGNSEGGPTNKSYYPSLSFKMYERGDDEKKKNGGWDDKSIDRLRLEYTAGREDLVEYGFKLLPSFINDCNIYEINNDIMKFKLFDRPYKYPKPLDVYPLNDAFYDTYVAIRKLGERPDKYIVDADIEELILLKKRISDALMAYDKAWRGSV